MSITVTNIVAGPYAATGAAQTLAFAFKVFTPSEIEVVVGGELDYVAVDPDLYTVTSDTALDGQIEEGGTVLLDAGAVAAGASVRLIAKPADTQGQSYSDTGSRLKNLNEGLDRAALRSLRVAYDLARGSYTLQNAVTYDPDTGEVDLSGPLSVPSLIVGGRRILQTVYSPYDFGAVGDGVANDGPALNAMFAAVRAAANASGAITQIPFSVDLGGGLWRTTISINATGIVAWNWRIDGGMILGECAGKAVLDLSGSRGYECTAGIFGDKINRPACGIQAQRGSTGYCDNVAFREVSVTGWFTRAAVHDYGQETSQWDHCTVFQYDHTGHVAIFEGFDAHPMTSDYMTVVTGGVSFINKRFSTCDFRYLPVAENMAAITAITNAASGVVTAPGHSFQVNDEVVFQYAGGMPNLAKAVGTVTARTTNTLTVNINTTALGTYTGGGIVVRRSTKSPIYIARCSGFSMDDCYVVAYGRSPITVGYPDPGFQQVVDLNLRGILFEGVGYSAAIFHENVGNVSAQGLAVDTYNCHAADCLMEAQGPGTVSLVGDVHISSFDSIFPIKVVGTPAKFAAFGTSITIAGIANVQWPSWVSFNGSITDLATGLTTEVNKRYAASGDAAFVPVLTDDAGDPITIGASDCSVQYFGKLAFVRFDFAIADDLGGTIALRATAPLVAAKLSSVTGAEIAATGDVVKGVIDTGQGYFRFTRGMNLYPAPTGARISASGWVPVA